MRWIVTEDIIDDGDSIGASGFDGNPIAHGDELIDFRLLDGDDIVYFIGQADREVYGTEEGFEPLDNFGSGWGCTEIQYLESGHWATL